MSTRFGWPGVLAGLPRLGWQIARYKTLRGGWLPGYLFRHRAFRRRRLAPNVPIDIIVVLVDHFEPASLDGAAAAEESVASWCHTYEVLAGRHRDADGKPPQHTWFYRAEYPNFGCLRALARSAFRGFGEVECHLHHGHDTHESFAAKLREGLDWFNQAGAMLSAEAEPRRRFAYIAGNWALDNGAGDDAKSGCNTEIAALRDAGCYADFTFPAIGSPAQPRKSNSIYYATDGPEPKSYDTGTDVAVGRPPSGDLLIFQGPLLPDWRAGNFESGGLESFALPSPARLDPWLKAHVHVRGRPEWVFVKLHTHGMQSRHALLGPGLDTLFRAMAERWNRHPFRLHYATAREAYNIVKAAEAGHQGDPNDCRNFQVAPPANRQIFCDAPWRLLAYEPERVSLEVLDDRPAHIELAAGPLRSVHGQIRRLDARSHNGEIVNVNVEGDAEFELRSSPSVVGSG